METLVKFCLVGLIVGAWFSEYVLKPLGKAVGHLINAAMSYIKTVGYKIELIHTKVRTTLVNECHPLLLLTLMVGLCVLLIQVRSERNDAYIQQNPQTVVSNWSIIP